VATLLAQGITATTSNGNGAASIDTTTTAGVVSLITTNSGSGSSASASLLTQADSGFTTATNMYFSALIRVSTLTGTESNMRVLVIDDAKRSNFGVQRAGGTLTVDGRWVDAAFPPAAIAAQAAINGNLRTASTLLEVQKIAGRVQARVGGSAAPWVALDGTSTGAGTNQYAQITCSAVASGSTASTTQIKRMTCVRY
jgi:hypothetical protein